MGLKRSHRNHCREQPTSNHIHWYITVAQSQKLHSSSFLWDSHPAIELSCVNSMKTQSSRSMFGVGTWCVLFILMAWPSTSVVQAQSGMFTDPFRTSNWRAVETDFMAWVDHVQTNHRQSVKAGEAALGYKDHSILAASNTIVVGEGGYNKVQDAVNAAPSGTRTIIQINSGTYK